jgi:membrane protein DedA with SNARE-associated domain
VDAHHVAHATLDWLSERPAWLSLGAVFVVAGMEYVIPPLPHDVVVVAAGVLAARAVLNPFVLLAVVTFGSMLGALAAWRIGSYAADHPGARKFVARFVDAESMAKMTDRFAKYGRLLLVANRFLPGLRTTLLFGAGLFRMRPLDVAITSAISAFLWNGLLIGAGVLLGQNLDQVLHYVEQYSIVAWIVVTLAVLAVIARALVHRHKRRHPKVAAVAR